MRVGAHRRIRAWQQRAVDAVLGAVVGPLLDRFVAWLATQLDGPAPVHEWSCGSCPAAIASADYMVVQRYAAAHHDRTGHYWSTHDRTEQ